MLDNNQQIFEQLKKAKSILITFSSIWNGDNLSSALSFYLFLKKMDKNVEIVSSKTESNNQGEGAQKIFSFLPRFNQIKRTIRNSNKFIISLDTTRSKIKKVNYKMEENSLKFIITPENNNFLKENVTAESQKGNYDLIVTLDTPDLQSLGKLFIENTDLFYKTPIINIDHHGGNEEYGQINLINLNAVSSSEILFSLFSSYNNIPINEDIATCLLAGIISKTKNFKTANITPETLTTTSALISKDARREEIINKLYRSRNINVLKLWGKVLSRLSGIRNNQIIWSIVNINDFVKTATTKNDLTDIIDELIINIPEAKIIILFYETPEDSGEPTTNFIIHSTKNINLMELVGHYNPKGDEKLVEIETKKQLEEVKKEIVELIDKKIGNINF